MSLSSSLSLKALCTLVLLTCSLVGTSAWAAPGLELLNDEPSHVGEYRMKELDMEIKVPGGWAQITRTYLRSNGHGSWQWNRRWNDLQRRIPFNDRIATASASAGGGGGGAAAGAPISWSTRINGVPTGGTDADIHERYADNIENHHQSIINLRRNETNYRRVSAGVYGGGAFAIQATPEGYTWKDRYGNKIHYSWSGTTKSYEDAEGNITRLVRDSQNRISQIVDANNRVVFTFVYINNESDLVDYIDAVDGRRVNYGYNDDNELTSVTDVRGKVWRYSHDREEGTLIRIDPVGNATVYYFDGRKLVKKVDPDEMETTYDYSYSASSQRYKFIVSRPDGTVTEEHYFDTTYKFRRGAYARVPSGGMSFGARAGGTADPAPKNIYKKWINGTLVSDITNDGEVNIYKDQFGQTYTTKEDLFGNVILKTYNDGTEESFEYDPRFNLPTRFVDREGNIFEWQYDDKARLTLEILGKDTPEERRINYVHTDTKTTVTYSGNVGASVTEEYIYDINDNVETFTDARQKSTDYTHNTLGQVLTTELPKGEAYTWTNTYDNVGNQLSEEDPLERTNTWRYDDAGRLYQQIGPREDVTEYGYDNNNMISRITDDSGNTIKSTYDREARTMTVTDALNRVVSSVQLNNLGVPGELTDGSGLKTRFNWRLYQIQSIQYPTYKEIYEYNNRQQIEAVTQSWTGGSIRNEFEYDPLDQIRKIIDSNDHVTETDYDSLGRVTEVLDAKQGTTKFTYDHRGNLLTVTDPEQRVTRFEYNDNDQVRFEIRTPEAGVEHIREYRYDDHGNLEYHITPEGDMIKYTYDVADQIDKVEVFANETATTALKTVDLGYNLFGQLESYSDGLTQGSYTYNKLGQLTDVTINYGPFSKSYRYTYDENGRLKTYTNPESIQYVYEYDAAGRIRTIFIPGQGNIVFSEYYWGRPSAITLPGGSSFVRSYDGVQRMTLNQLLDPASSSIQEQGFVYDGESNLTELTNKYGTYSFAYDELDRLQNTSYPDLYTVTSETFGYDGVHNRTAYSATQNDTTTNISGSVNDANALKTYGSATYHYDKNGHLIEKVVSTGSTHFIYNEEERLVRVENNDRQVVAEYRYDPFGRRIWKEVSGARTYFLHDHTGLRAEYDSSGNLIREYHYMPGSPWMSDPLFQRTGGKLYYYQNDHLGTPQQLIKPNGQLVWAARYSAFGKADIVMEAVSNPLRFAGQYFDAETGLHHNWNRDYDPEIGRYIQRDPIGLEGGINTYGYAHQNPLARIDPDGTIAPIIWALGRAAAQAYGRCVLSCSAAGVGKSATDPCSPTPLEASKSCAKTCLNPLNWGGGKGPKGSGIKSKPGSSKNNIKPDEVKKNPGVVSRANSPRENSRAKRRAAREAQRQNGTPTSRSGTNHQNKQPNSPRHQTKEGADGSLDGIVDGSKDTAPGHGPHVEVGKVKPNEPFNKYNQPRLQNGKSKVEY